MVKIIWSVDALNQLEDIHFYILFETKSIRIADKVIEKIFESTKVLKASSEIYELDEQRKMMEVLELLIYTITKFLIELFLMKFKF